MASILILHPYEENFRHLVRTRLLLGDDKHWRQLPIGNSKASWSDKNFFKVGRWGLCDARTGMKNTVLIGGESANAACLTLYDYYPLFQGKTGTGLYTHFHGGRPDASPGDFLEGTKCRFTIEWGDAPLQNVPYRRKVAMALGLAWHRCTWDKVAEKYLELFTWQNALGFGGFAAAHLVGNSKASWVLLRSIAGKAMLWAMLFDYAYRLDRFCAMVDVAYTMADLEEAGLYMADFLACLARDAGIAVVTALVVKLKSGGKESADGEGNHDHRRPAKTSNGKPAPAEPLPQVAKPLPIPRPESWRTAYKVWVEHYKKLGKLAKQALEQGDLANYRAWLERAVQARFQAHMLRLFILETIHHVEVMSKLGPKATELMTEMKQIIQAAGSEQAALQEMRTRLILKTKLGGFELEVPEAQRVAEMILEDHKSGKLTGNYDWTTHDVDQFMTSKLNMMIAEGMKIQIKLPRGLKMDQLEMLLEGLDPQTGKPITPARMKELFGAEEYQKLLNSMGSQEAVLASARRTHQAIGCHNTCCHHNPQIVDHWIEAGCDIAHALTQWRAYRAKALSAAEILKELKTFPNKPGVIEKMYWAKVGLSLMKKLDPKTTVDPVSNVSTQTLQKYGQTELVNEMLGRGN